MIKPASNPVPLSVFEEIKHQVCDMEKMDVNSEVLTGWVADMSENNPEVLKFIANAIKVNSFIRQTGIINPEWMETVTYIILYKAMERHYA